MDIFFMRAIHGSLLAVYVFLRISLILMVQHERLRCSGDVVIEFNH